MSVQGVIKKSLKTVSTPFENRHTNENFDSPLQKCSKKYRSYCCLPPSRNVSINCSQLQRRVDDVGVTISSNSGSSLVLQNKKGIETVEHADVAAGSSQH